jgi:ribose transport system substrate-binding protein
MKHGIFYRTICVLLSLLLILTLFGCGKAEDSTSSDEADYFDFEPITEIKDGRKNIYVVLKVMTGQYWESLAQGIADSGNENNCNVYLGGPIGEGDWETQDKMLRTAVDSGADAIMLSPANSTALSSVISEIHNKGIPVILVDTILNDTSIFDTCYMTDNLQAGGIAASEMLRQLKQGGASEKDKLQVAIQITSVSSQTVIDRLAGFNQYWSANAPANWTVLDEVKLNNGAKDKAKQNCIDFLNEYPDIKGVFGCNNSSTIGFVNGLTEENRDDVALVGFDYADETAAFISSHNAATIVQNQYNMGYDGLKQALDMLNGEAADYKFIDTGTLEVNKDNQADYESKKAGGNK